MGYGMAENDSYKVVEVKGERFLVFCSGGDFWKAFEPPHWSGAYARTRWYPTGPGGRDEEWGEICSLMPLTEEAQERAYRAIEAAYPEASAGVKDRGEIQSQAAWERFVKRLEAGEYDGPVYPAEEGEEP